MDIRIQTTTKEAEALTKVLSVRWRPMRERGAAIYLRDATPAQLVVLAQHEEAAHG